MKPHESVREKAVQKLNNKVNEQFSEKSAVKGQLHPTLKRRDNTIHTSPN